MHRYDQDLYIPVSLKWIIWVPGNWIPDPLKGIIRFPGSPWIGISSSTEDTCIEAAHAWVFAVNSGGIRGG